jgi:phosphatidylglycerophosphate synthase
MEKSKMLDRVALKLSQPLVDSFARRALRRGWIADYVSFGALACGIVAALFIIVGNPGVALIPLLASRLADGMDGAMARMTDTQSDRGAFLDIVFDFIFYAMIPLAFAVGNPVHNALPAAVLLAAFITTGTSFLAYATIAAERGETSEDYPDKGIYYLGGLTEGSETIAAFCAMCWWPQWFGIIAYVFAALCLVTTATRILAGWSSFAR